MTIRQVLDKVLATLPEDRLRQVLDFAMFLKWQDEDKQWQQFSLEQLARAYGDEEPEYTEADLKRN